MYYVCYYNFNYLLSMYPRAAHAPGARRARLRAPGRGSALGTHRTPSAGGGWGGEYGGEAAGRVRRGRGRPPRGGQSDLMFR